MSDSALLFRLFHKKGVLGEGTPVKRGDSFQAAMSPFFGDRWAIIITSFLDITPVARPSTTWSIHQHRTHALKIQGFKVDRAETSGLRQIGVNPMSCCSAVIAHGSPPSAPPVRMSPNCCQSTGRALSNIFLSPLPLPARANNDEARPMMEGEGSSLDDLMVMGPESFLDEAFEAVDATNTSALCDKTKAHGQKLKNGDSLLIRTVSDISTTTDSAVAAEVGQPKSSKPAVAPKSNVPTSTRCVQKRRRANCCDARTSDTKWICTASDCPIQGKDHE